MKHETRREMALKILSDRDQKLTRKSGSFLGQCVVDQTPLSEKQENWFNTLADRAGLIVEGEPA